MPRRVRDGEAEARAGAEGSVPSAAAITRADQHDAAVLRRLGGDTYTRAPLLGEFPPVDGVRLVLVVRGPLGSFVRQGYDVAELPADAHAEALEWARNRAAHLDMTFGPKAARANA